MPGGAASGCSGPGATPAGALSSREGAWPLRTFSRAVGLGRGRSILFLLSRPWCGSARRGGPGGSPEGRGLKGAWRAAMVALAAVALTAAACGGQGDARTLEKRAQVLDSQLMCPICAGQTIDQSKSDLSDQMQAAVRRMLAEGRSDQEIKDFFVERYGPSVLAAPPARGFNLIAWIVPPVGIVGGVVLLYLVVRAMGRREPGEPGALEGAGAPLDPYLALVDREMGRLEGSGGGPEEERKVEGR